MNITTERHSLLRLWLESFAVVGRSAGQLVGLILIAITVWGLLIWAAISSLGGITALISKAQTSVASGVVGILGAFGMYVLVMLLINISSIFFFTVLARIIAAQATQQKVSFVEHFAASIVPTIWQILAGLMIGIPFVILGALAVLLLHNILVLYILMGVLLFTVGIRLAYAYVAIAVKNKGPIEGFRYSWQLTEGAYGETFLMLLMCVGTGILIRVIIEGMLYGLKVAIPLYFADSFSFTSPVWWIVGIVVGIICLCFYIVPMVFPILVFLNRDGGSDAYRRMSADNNQPIPVSPFPTEDLPNLHPTVVAETYVEEGLPPETERIATQRIAIQSGSETDASTQKEKAVGGRMDNLELSQASIHSSEVASSDIDQHLGQVYTPSSENTVQQGDEDRMPTILFDEDMAKQLEENAKQFASHKKDKQEPEDQGPIKISK